MSCQNENRFQRFSDTPSIDNVGFVKVASSKDQLDNMSQEDKERVVASVALLDSFNESLKDSIQNLINQSLEQQDNTLIDEKIQEVVEQLSQLQNKSSLDIPFLSLIPTLSGAELRWTKPSYDKPYKVKIYQGNHEQKTYIASINGTRDYYLLKVDPTTFDETNKPTYFVQAYDGDTLGNPSPVVGFEGENWSDILIDLLRGKIGETQLSRDLIDTLYSGFSNTLNAEIEKSLNEARQNIAQATNQINNVIGSLRDNINVELISVKDQLRDHGTGISTLERTSENHSERIDRISAVANDAIAGIQSEKVARATELEAFTRETDTKISQVEGSIATVRNELKTQATKFDSTTQELRDFKNTYNANEVRTTEKFTQLANADQAIAEKVRDVTAKTESSEAKIQDLEEVLAEQDKSSAKRFSSLRSSINGSHFPNYNFEGELEGWASNENSTLNFVTLNDPSAPVPQGVEITGNMPATIYSDEPTKVEVHKTYTFNATVKNPDGLTKAQLVMMCFDKNKQLITNIQTDPTFPLVQEKLNQGSQWVKLSGKISGHTTEFPTTVRDKMPMHTAYATPALILYGNTGSKFWVTQLDMQDTSGEEQNLAEIKKLEQTQNEANRSVATKFEEVTAKFTDVNSNISGVTNQVEQVKNEVKKVDGKIVAEASKLSQLTSEVGANKSSINSLQQVINDEKSASASKFETLNAKFKRDLANVIENPEFVKEEITTTLNNQDQAVVTGTTVTSSTDGWTVSPANKFRVITNAQNTITAHKTKFPSNYYLKTWGNSVVPKNQLSVSEGDKIFVGAGIYHHPATPKLQVIVRYLNKDGNLVSQANVGNQITGPATVKLAETLTVPAGVSKAELVFFTGNNTLAENTGYSIISKPEFRMNMAAIYADSAIEKAQTVINNAQQSLANEVNTLRADYNGNKAQVQQELQARAEADRVTTSKIEQQTAELNGQKAKLTAIEATQVTDREATSQKLEEMKTEFNSELTQAKSSIDTLKGTVDNDRESATRQVNEAKGEFTSKIQESETRTTRAISDAENRVVSQVNTVRNIANKATSDIQTLTNTVNTKDQARAEQISNLNSTFTQTIDEKTRELNTKIDSIEVGSRNLIKNTENPSNTDKMIVVSETNYLLRSGVVSYPESGVIRVTRNGTGECYYRFVNPVSTTNLQGKLERGKYTVSGFVRASNTSRLQLQTADATTAWRYQYPPEFTNLSSTEWQYFKHTFEIREDATGYYFGFVDRREVTDGSVWFEFKKMKLEKGTIATDWTPAPEDIESKVSSLSQTIINSTAEINSIKQTINTAKGSSATLADSLNTRFSATQTNAVNTAKSYTDTAKTALEGQVTQARTHAENKATEAKNQAISQAGADAQNKANKALNDAKADAQNKVNIAKNELTPLVNNAQAQANKGVADALAAQTTANQANTRLDNLKVGGRNFLSATATMLNFKKRVNVWHYIKQSTETTARLEPVEDTDGTSYIILRKAVANTWSIWYQNARQGTQMASDNASPSLAKVQIGREYTISFEARRVAGSSNLKFIFREIKRNGSQNNRFNQTFNITNSEWVKFSATFTLSYGTSAVDSDYWQAIFASDSAVGEIQIRKPMLEEGNIASDWSPAPEDTEQSLNEFAVDFEDYKGAVANDRLALGRTVEQIQATLNVSSNLAFDSEFTEGLSEQLDKEGGDVAGYHRAILGDGKNPALDVLKLEGLKVGYVANFSNNVNNQYGYFTTAHIPAVPGIYQFSIYAKNLSSTTSVDIYAEILDDALSAISGLDSSKYQNLTSRRLPVRTDAFPTSPQKLSDFTRVVFNVDLSSFANLSYVRLIVRLNKFATQSNENVVLFCKPQIVKIKNLDVPEIPYSPGPTKTSVIAKFNEVRTALTTETGARTKLEQDLTTNFLNSTAGRKIKEFAESTANSARASAVETMTAEIRGSSGANILPNPEFKQFTNLTSLPTSWTLYNNEVNRVTQPCTIAITPNAGLNNSNSVKISWTGQNTYSKGIYYTSSNVLWEVNRYYIIAICARVPAGVTPSGSLSLHNSNNPNWSDVSYISQPTLTNQWQWYVMKARKTTTGELRQLFFTIINSNANTTAIEYCLPYASAGDSWTGYKTPDYTSDLVATKAEIVSTREIAVDAQGKVNAKIGLVVNAQGKAIGWTAGTGTNGQSNFNVMANNFKISNGTTDYSPFEIIGNQVYFRGKVNFSSVENPPAIPSVPKSITVIGTSNAVDASARYPFVRVDSTIIREQRGRGLTIVVLNKDTLAAITQGVYDTYTEAGCNTFKTTLDSIRSNLGQNILCIYSFDASIVNDNLKLALNSLIPNLGTSYENALKEKIHSSLAVMYQKISNSQVVTSYNLTSSSNNVMISGIVKDGILSSANAIPVDTNKMNSLAIKDTRSLNQPPSWYRLESNTPLGLAREMKLTNVVGIPGSSSLATVQTDVKWRDTTAGPIHQTATLNDGSIYVRVGSSNDSSWGSWTKANPTTEETRQVVRTTEIDGGMIRTGIVDATRIDAKVINTGKNLIKNPILANLNGLKGWYIQNFYYQEFYTKGENLTYWWLPSNSIMFDGERSLNFDGIVASGRPYQLFTDCEVKPNTTYLLSYWYQNHGQAHKLRLDCSEKGVGQYNRNGETTLTLITNPGAFDKNLSNNTRTVYKIVTGPNTRFLRPIWYFDIVGQRAHFAFARPMLEEVHPLNTTPSSFTNSGVIIDETRIKTPNLSALSADMGHITAGKITSGSGNSGIVIDPRTIRVYDGGVLKVRIGDLGYGATNISNILQA